jgi:hypothetical protein
MKFTDKRGQGQKNFVIPNKPIKRTPEEIALDNQKAVEEHIEMVKQEDLRLRGMEAEKARSVDSFRLPKRLQKLSFIEEHEEEEAIRQIEELMGFERPRVCGYMISVKIYVRDEDIGKILDKDGRETLLYAPPRVSAHDKFRNCSGLVLGVGPTAYKDPKFMGIPWCKIGDWVMIARNGGPQVNFRGIPVTTVPDDNIYMTLECPTHVTRD